MSSSSNNASVSPDSTSRASMSSTRNSLEKTLSNTQTSSSSPRRSSDVRFNNLEQFKRGGDNYESRRASHADMHAPSGLFGGWFNSTFKGYQGKTGGN
ncbi:uncharacterized protein K489DRAFT_435011 [Dissoconium aciculare CBS 342.82]|uniref:Conidiation-specific expression protein n=1 Tax=Dissoconium aciculare CBS 342.82 TaxID=1314786 RepID=A0A6J3LRY0_9PEZI|nr:uncharacterized protein K489DRAFT_435011 [Dissoconium aciculare CBS 342.82]KAF1818555.1 hypothetical protein K489DRAFT_435011 [Dissoconium aciculare CBS 342.82]